MNNIQALPNASHNSQYSASPEKNRFPLRLWERVRVRGSSVVETDEANTTASQIGIAVMLAALLLFAATFARAASLDEMLIKRKPEASIDLATKEGAQLVKGEWRYSDTKIVEVDFRAAGRDGQPGDTPIKSYDFTPHAGRADFDDSKWEVIDPTSLDKRRSAGKLAFNWYRIKITIPERIGDFDPTGSTLVFFYLPRRLRGDLGRQRNSSRRRTERRLGDQRLERGESTNRRPRRQAGPKNSIGNLRHQRSDLQPAHELHLREIRQAGFSQSSSGTGGGGSAGSERRGNSKRSRD